MSADEQRKSICNNCGKQYESKIETALTLSLCFPEKRKPEDQFMLEDMIKMYLAPGDAPDWKCSACEKRRCVQ